VLCLTQAPRLRYIYTVSNETIPSTKGINVDNEQDRIANVIRNRIANCPDDYYITDAGTTLYALLAGEYLWSMSAPYGQNFHLMTEAKIALLIHEELSKKLG
jgi:hypothetical protein